MTVFWWEAATEGSLQEFGRFLQNPSFAEHDFPFAALHYSRRFPTRIF
jgi:hypothetical protein